MGGYLLRQYRQAPKALINPKNHHYFPDKSSKVKNLKTINEITKKAAYKCPFISLTSNQWPETISCNWIHSLLDQRGSVHCTLYSVQSLNNKAWPAELLCTKLDQHQPLLQLEECVLLEKSEFKPIRGSFIAFVIPYHNMQPPLYQRSQMQICQRGALPYQLLLYQKDSIDSGGGCPMASSDGTIWKDLLMRRKCFAG